MSNSESLSDPLSFFSSKNEEKLAKKTFTLIHSYCSERSEEKELEFARKLLEIGFNASWELKDEIFLQICKQINCNINEMSLMKLFVLLAMSASAFPVSLRLYFPILNFLYSQIEVFSQSSFEDKAAFRSYAKLCFIRILRLFEGKPRKFIPSKRELICIMTMQQIMIPISLVNNWGKSLWIPVESYSTVCEAKCSVLKKFNIGVRGCYYGLFLHKNHNGEFEETLINEEDIFLDIIDVCDKEKEDFETRVKAGKQKGFNSLWFYDYKVILKLKVYYQGIADLEMETDGLCMAYAQHQCEVLKSNFNLSELNVIKLAALALYINAGSSDGEVNMNINLEDYVPKNMKNELSQGIWLEKISFEHAKLKQMNKYEAMKKYLDALKNCELFFAQLFTVEYVKIEDKKESAKIKAICAIKPKEVIFINEKTRKYEEKYELKQVLKFGVNKDSFFLMITEDGKTHFCESMAAKSINYMMSAYINMSIGRGIDFKEKF